MKTQQINTPRNTLVELNAEEIRHVAGGQASASYCVYGNGKVGAHDFSQMVSRPLNANETCSR